MIKKFIQKLFKKEEWCREDLITMARYNPNLKEAIKEEKRILRKSPSLSLIERLKLFLIIILMFVVAVNPAWATNTHTTDLNAADSEYWSITDANQTGLDITGDISIEAWIKVTQLPTTTGATFMIVSKRNGSGNDESYNLNILSPDNRLRFIYSSNGGVVAASRTILDTVADFLDSDDVGEWVHVAFSVDVSEASGVAYKNGSSFTMADVTTGNATSIFNSASAFRIGAILTSATNFFDGSIDDVRIWNDVRTSTEISDNYNCSLAGNETNLQGYWRFDNNGEDSTSNNNDLTNNNTATFQSASLPFTNTCGETPVTEDKALLFQPIIFN